MVILLSINADKLGTDREATARVQGGGRGQKQPRGCRRGLHADKQLGFEVVQGSREKVRLPGLRRWPAAARLRRVRALHIVRAGEGGPRAVSAGRPVLRDGSELQRNDRHQGVHYHLREDGVRGEARSRRGHGTSGKDGWEQRDFQGKLQGHSQGYR